jgi:small subunit ribosomal protein S6
MADHTPTYDLVLLLSSDAPEEQRSRILSSVESAITTAGGSVERNDDWGRRPMSYEIRHRPEAEYHLLQFQAPATLIEELSHTLRITDGVLRHRIIKVKRGTPPLKPGTPPVISAVASSSDGMRPGRSAAPDEEAEAAAVAVSAESEPAAEEAAPDGDYGESE